MASGRFGTDGIRGLANAELSPELALALGRASARVLGRGPFLIGRDTRHSGPMLAAAFAAGLASEGADVDDLGVLPTPGVAALCAKGGLPGAVVSASHNPFADNGIKILSAGGAKLSDEAERAIEIVLDHLHDADDGDRPTGSALGAIRQIDDAVEDYLEVLGDSLRPGSLDGLRIVVDCAHGAATPVAEAALRAAGALVSVIGAEPTGENINEGVGSTHPEALAAEVLARGAALGLALDGDADRLIAVDELGRVVDGDRLIALFACDLMRRGMLSGDAVVVTVMSNLGFHRAMGTAGIAVRTVGVGDRNVLAALDDEGLVLGGEQSGHLIFRDRATTGDGLLSGLLLAELLVASGRPLSAMADEVMDVFPQVLLAIRVPDAAKLADAASIWTAVAEAEAELGDDGRVLVRASGTEPVVRIMVEAAEQESADRLAARLASTVESALR